MISIKGKKNCCGCGACEQICPKNCIAMVADEEGFLYPQVDTGKCVQCGLCQRVCPMLAGINQHTDAPEAFAAYAKNDTVRQQSSSGGIFSLLAEWVLRENGVVFGAAFDDDFSVHHIKVESLEELHKIRGSKYLQSRIENTYAEAKAELEMGRIVLFSGVGCQIAGLKSYLKKEYQNLYTVDVLCHGVPSPKVWRHYLREQERCYQAEAVHVSFRAKNTGWKNYSEEQIFRNGRKYNRRHCEDLYIFCFLRDVCLRPSCHSCRFRKGRSGADITLGDAWGIEKWMPEMDDDRGTSIVLVNSSKGCQLWKQVEEFAEAKPGDPDEILKHNPVYYRSVPTHPNRRRFFAALNRNASMAELAGIARKPLYLRCISRGKRMVKSLLRKLGIL